VALLIGAFCVVPAVLDGSQMYFQARLVNAPGTPWQQIYFNAGEWIILGALTSLVYVLAVRFPLRGATLRRNLLIHAGGALMLCVSWASLGIALRAALGLLPRTPLSRHAASWLLTSIPWSVFLYFTVLGSVLAFAYFFEAKEREAQAARLTAQVAEARLSALRMQLHPHFLFNSLNAVAVLVRDARNADAARVVEQLSDILRQVLAEEHTREVRLDDELAFVRKYLAIEETRFSDRLNVRWSIAEHVGDAMVPSFILQPLVENAIRHGVALVSERTSVDISAAEGDGALLITVTNDAPGAEVRTRSRGRGVGVANTKERLNTLYGDDASLTYSEANGRVTATVRLPLHRAPVSAAGVA
jgi:hypothetical protein